jgi:hypothetical protein
MTQGTSRFLTDKNTFPDDQKSEPEYAYHFELLVRSILLRPDHPAVIVLGHYSPQTQEVHTFLGPDTIHSSVAQFYDVPHIRSAILLHLFHLVLNPV